MDTLFISVIVCAFNEEKLLQECLEGLVSQTFPKDHFEILIIDDESTDNTFNVASSFIENGISRHPTVKLIRIRHGGLSVARNTGIRFARGEVVAFIDGDAIPDGTWLEELSKPFYGSADFVGGRIELLNETSGVGRFLQLTRHRQFFGPRVFNNQFIGCNMAFRRQIFDEVGGFHENFESRGDETTLWARLEGKYHYAPAPCAVVRHERPTTFTTAIRVEWQSATLKHLSNRIAKKRLGLRSVASRIEKSLVIAFPLTPILLWVNARLFFLSLIFSAIAVVRQCFVRSVNRAILEGLMKRYGLVRGCIGHLVFCYASININLWGWLIGFWRYRHVEVRPPTATRINVLNTVVNNPTESKILS